ncbi:synaptic vesicular amine transporter-like isoform X3 [Branchiostoma floridae x Branchiostoma japonicum]
MTNKARCSLSNFRKSRALVLIVAFLAMFVDTVLTTVMRPIMPDYLYRLEHPNYTGAIITNKHIDNKPVTSCKGGATCLPIAPSQNLQRIKQLEKLSVKLGILYAAGPASSLITNPIAGWLADRFGYTLILYIGIVLIFASTIGFTFSTSYSALFVSQLVQGVGGSFSVIAAFIMLSMTFTDADRAKAIGVAQTGMTLGVLIGPVIGGVMYEFLGYKSPFLLIAGLAVVDGGESGRLFEFKLIEGPIRSTSCSILIRWNGSICYGWGDGTGLDDDVYERFSVATRSFGIACGRRLYHWNFSLFHAGGKNRALAADFGWNPRIGSLYGHNSPGQEHPRVNRALPCFWNIQWIGRNNCANRNRGISGHQTRLEIRERLRYLRERHVHRHYHWSCGLWSFDGCSGLFLDDARLRITQRPSQSYCHPTAECTKYRKDGQTDNRL